MKKIILCIFLFLAAINFTLASEDTPYEPFIRGHFIYVDKVFDGSDADDGLGFSLELGAVLTQQADISQSLSLEFGFIFSEPEYTFAPPGGVRDVDITVIPVLANYTISGNIASNFIWEFGGGLGAYIAEIDAGPSVGNFSFTINPVVFGGQLFGRVGYYFGEGFDVTAGVRYMVSDEINNFGIDENFNTVAFDISASYAY